jgi:hypothetical protein
MTNHEPERLDNVTQRQLADAFDAPPFPDARIRARLQRTLGARTGGSRSPVRWLAAATLAAAVLLAFIGGVEYGRRLPARPDGGQVNAMADLPMAIQSAGTDYITAVGRFADLRDSLSINDRDQAREVALAVLYGVVVELLRSEAADPEFARVIQAAMARQRAASEAVLWF